MKVVSAFHKAFWSDSRGVWRVQLELDTGQIIDIDDFRVLSEIASCTRHAYKNDETGENFIPVLTPEELEKHRMYRKKGSVDMNPANFRD